MYDNQPYPPEVRYEVARLPLQGYICTARVQLQVGWKAGQERWQRFQLSMKETVTAARTRVQGMPLVAVVTHPPSRLSPSSDQLKSVGVTNPAAVAKFSAIGGAGLTGYIIARKSELRCGTGTIQVTSE